MREQAIKNIKMSVKRAKATAAGITEVATIDIYQEIYLGDGNLEMIHGLIDQKIEAKRNVAHAIVKGLLDYKSLLSEDQTAKLKDIWYDKKYSGDQSAYGSCGKCGQMRADRFSRYQEVRPMAGRTIPHPMLWPEHGLIQDRRSARAQL